MARLGIRASPRLWSGLLGRAVTVSVSSPPCSAIDIAHLFLLCSTFVLFQLFTSLPLLVLHEFVVELSDEESAPCAFNQLFFPVYRAATIETSATSNAHSPRPDPGRCRILTE